MFNQYCLLLLYLLCLVWTNAEPLLEIPQGTLNGKIEESRNGRKYAAFLGIPYARPPIGNRRFKNPEPADKWNGIRKADSFGDACPQFNDAQKIVGNEDCLFINVYTPLLNFNSSNNEETGRTLLPVMVFIHGGAFRRGSSDCCPANYFLDKDIVLVLMNYRVDIFGFLSTGDSAAPGNFGLKDQVMALKWIQENIKAFGGDPNKVTLLGQSAGGASVAFHALSKASNGLFHKYIVQSGNPFADWTHTKSSNLLEAAKKIGQVVSCPFNNSESFIDCLRTKSVDTLMNAKSLLGESGDRTKISWLPTDEPVANDAFLTDIPSNLMNQNQMKDLPFMTGCVTDEALAGTAKLYLNSSKYSFVTKHIDKIIGSGSGSYLEPEKEKEFVAAAKELYFNNSIDGSDKDKFIRSYTNFASDTQYLYPEVRMVEKVSSTIKSPVYFYSFGYRGRVTLQSNIENNRNLGVGHGADVVYIFPFSSTTVGLPKLNFTSTEQSISELLIDVLTSFATSGKPISKHLKNDNFWVPYDSKKTFHLQIGNINNNTDPTVTLSNNYFTERMNFWRKYTPL